MQVVHPALRGAATYLAVVQFLLATTWTIYVIYLPSLLESVGIPRSTTAWILLLDQLTFTVTDFFLGFAADRVSRVMGRLGPAIIAATGISCLAFLAMPFVTGIEGPLATVLLLGAIGIWVVTSSALRAPPWVMIVQYAAIPKVPLLAAIMLVGVSVAAATSSYIGVMLRGVDPRLPFILSSCTLFVVTTGLIWLEKGFAVMRKEAPAAVDAVARVSAPGRPGPSVIGTFLAGAVLFALGFQIHIVFNSTDQYLRFATPADLDQLLPLFWVGFNVLSLPVFAATPRWGGPRVMASAAVIGVLGTFLAASASNLTQTIIGQMLAGGAWGALMTAGLSSALGFGRAGREGAISGLWFSTLSMAAFVRLSIVVTQFDRRPGFTDPMPYAPTILWCAAGLILLGLVLRARSARVMLTESGPV